MKATVRNSPLSLNSKPSTLKPQMLKLKTPVRVGVQALIGTPVRVGSRRASSRVSLAISRPALYFMVWGLGSGISGFRFRVSGFGFRV